MADRSTKRPRSSDRKHLDSSEIKSMFKTVMRRLSAIEQEQKRYRRSLTPSFDYSTGSDNDLDHYDDDADADELITGEDESQSVQGNNNAPESVAADNLIPTTVNISSILGEDEIQERVFSEPILEELVPRYTKVLLGGLKEESIYLVKS
ncbi:unnamed protein product [Acanthoscelides obtectus]|uniref:Uncharacterized protein n=1 Tax=Acanthoscelides obtectus TaxID=200917 RepID=A0A9P0M863_ACAOB|nr:unnamed protein product [Acanthoscelides obtectus]CAH1975033.1 unnamed protein product [Acanthoscelides obtectus]CAH1975787.1 unnamed protein product [Acanthoscelides obtectus]CAH1984121.1 unnamed protein product [Acanthoscelides obtectus]CAH1997420.1 unnamed protein product [Acanthoscelides obtectus]